MWGDRCWMTFTERSALEGRLHVTSSFPRQKCEGHLGLVRVLDPRPFLVYTRSIGGGWVIQWKGAECSCPPPCHLGTLSLGKSSLFVVQRRLLISTWVGIVIYGWSEGLIINEQAVYFTFHSQLIAHILSKYACDLRIEFCPNNFTLLKIRPIKYTIVILVYKFFIRFFSS